MRSSLSEDSPNLGGLFSETAYTSAFNPTCTDEVHLVVKASCSISSFADIGNALGHVQNNPLSLVVATPLC